MSAFRDRFEPLVMLEMRDYELGRKVSIPLWTHLYPVTKNGVTAATRRIHWIHGVPHVLN